jgi:hypothetical protein
MVTFRTRWLPGLLPSPIFQRGIWMLHESGLPALRGEREVGCSGGLVAPLGHPRWRRSQGEEADVDPRRADLSTPQ